MITMHNYEVNEVILQENDIGNTVYVIEQGRVKITKELHDRQVHLAYLGSGHIFGIMDALDDACRYATVTAVEMTRVREIPRDDFFRGLQTEPARVLELLRSLCMRLRETYDTLSHMQANAGTMVVLPSQTAEMVTRIDVAVRLEGLTALAAQALPITPFEIETFPFCLGRESRDPLSHPDLMLPDTVPLQISRQHLAFVRQAGRIGVVDTGSRLGSWVDGRQLGGPSGESGPLFFTDSEGLLILGTQQSPFRYRVRILTNHDSISTNAW